MGIQGLLYIMKKNKRSTETELADLGPDYYTQEEYQEYLVQLGQTGRFLGGNKATLAAFAKSPCPQSILDVGCGGGHFTIQLARRYPNAQVVGIDISPDAIEYAKKQAEQSRVYNVSFEVSGAPQLAFPPKSFDAVTSTLVCHHFSDQQFIEFLKYASRIAKSTIIINDLHRHWLASAGFRLIAGPFFPNRLFFKDGLVSIRRGFKKNELLDYVRAADISLDKCEISWHWAFRWILRIDLDCTSIPLCRNIHHRDTEAQRDCVYHKEHKEH